MSLDNYLPFSDLLNKVRKTSSNSVVIKGDYFQTKSRFELHFRNKRSVIQIPGRSKNGSPMLRLYLERICVD